MPISVDNNVMDSISVVVFDTRLLRELRQMEIDFVNQLDVYYRCPGQWALSSPVIPTRRLDERYSRLREKEFEWTSSVVKSMTGMLETNQLEYCWRLYEKELKRLSSEVECAMLGASPRKIRSMDASGARRIAGTVSGVAIEPQLDEQVVCQGMTGELSNSLSEIRKETHNRKTKWRHVFVNHKPKPSTIVCCHERELCGLIYVYILICQTEEGLMRIMNSYMLTTFLDVKTEVAGFETEPIEESTGHAQARGLILR